MAINIIKLMLFKLTYVFLAHLKLTSKLAYLTLNYLIINVILVFKH